MTRPKDDLTEFQMMCFKKAVEKRSVIEDLRGVDCEENIIEFVKGESFAYSQMAKWIEGYRLNAQKEPKKEPKNHSENQRTINAQKNRKNENNSELVRCKDCKRAFLNGNRRYCALHLGADEVNRIDDNNYCSHGERKEHEID